MSALPGYIKVNLLRYRERAIDLNARYRTVLSIFVVAEQELDGPKIAGADRSRRVRPPEGMVAEKLRIKSGSDDPFRDKPRVLACRHAAALIAAAREQKFARLFTRRSQVAVDGFAPSARILPAVASSSA